MITVVICSYKYGHLAAHAIDSVISQTLIPSKILFVDDGVGDCKHLPPLYPEVEYILRQKNLGTVDNFQDMLQRVDTEYVMFLGADNWLRQDTLATFADAEIADITTYDIIVTGEFANEITRRHPQEVTPHPDGYYWDRSSGHHGSMIYNTELAKSVGGYCDGHGKRTSEDATLYQRMLKAKATRIHIPEAFLYYRRHRDNFNQVT